MTTPASTPARSPEGDGGRFRAPVLALLLLTLTAGYADGFSLTRWDVFVANQSGNVVRIGMGVTGHYPAWDLAVMSMAGFAGGVALSWALSRWAGTRTTLLVRLRLVSAAALIVLWAGLATLGIDPVVLGRASAFLGAAAMGTTATTLTHVAGMQAQSTYQTATVIRTTQGLLDWASGDAGAPGRGRRLAILGGLTLLCYASGGAIGAIVADGIRYGLAVPVLLLVGAVALVRPSAQ